MSTYDPEKAKPAPLTSLPRIEDVPFAEHGYDPDQIRSAFEAFQRHVTQLQAQLRVLQAAGRANVEPSGHAIRMDALHLIRSAAEFADALERDAQNASANQLSRTEEEIRTRQLEAAARESDVERFRQESERQRQEILGVARNEARELLANAQREASQELREAEARGNKLLEQSRHQATELTNTARAEVEGALEWARAQAASIMMRAQQGAEQLLTAAGLGESKVGKVAESIVQAAERESRAARSPGGVVREAPAPRPTSAPVPPAPQAPAVPPAPTVPTPPPAAAARQPEPEARTVEAVEKPSADAQSAEEDGGWKWGAESPEDMPSAPVEEEPPSPA